VSVDTLGKIPTINPSLMGINRNLRMMMKFPFDPEEAFNGAAGDNLFDPEDDHDETESFNWRNNPIRQAFDNHRQSSHRSHEETNSITGEG
jgi:hypothetical protein